VDSSDALTNCRRQLNETTAAFWSDAEIYGYLSEAERLLAGKIGGYQVRTAHTTVTGTSTYTMPAGCLRIDRVTYDGKKLKGANFRDRDFLDGTDYGSTLQSGKPEIYIPFGSEISLFPVPDDAKTLQWFFRKTPTRITNATAFTIQEETLQEMLPDYAIWKCSLKDQELARADRHKQAWDQNLTMAASIWSDRETQDTISHVRDEDEFAGGQLGMD
jgi:hypothetical protein